MTNIILHSVSKKNISTPINHTPLTRPPFRGNPPKKLLQNTNPSKFTNGTVHNTDRKVNAIKRRTPRRACSEYVMFADGVQSSEESSRKCGDLLSFRVWWTRTTEPGKPKRCKVGKTFSRDFLTGWKSWKSRSQPPVMNGAFSRFVWRWGWFFRVF